jgi:glutamate-1-semialdehyde 2,1-aminomutase
MGKTVCIIQARMGSTRLPGKVLKPIMGRAAIDLQNERISRSVLLDEIVYATSTLEKDDVLARHLADAGHAVCRGSETDVLARYAQAAEAHEADTIVRVTGDCPLIDPALVDILIERFQETGADYCSNVIPPSYPHGMDAEVFSRRVLDTAHARATLDRDREHVTQFLIREPEFTRESVMAEDDFTGLRVTLDEAVDLDAIRMVCDLFGGRTDMGWREIADRVSQENIVLPNAHLSRP